jgi:uncharacterized membrane protein YfcA
MTEILAAIPASSWIVVTAIMAAGAALQAAFGMGIALFAIPLLALIDPRFVPGPLLFASLWLSVGMAYAGRADIRGGEIGLASIGLAAGTVLGAVALILAPAGSLPRVFGALILFAVLISCSGLAIRSTPRALLGGGTLAGIMGVMAGIHGPPMALIFQNDAPERARAMMGAFFAAAYPLSIAGMALVGLFGMLELTLGLVLVPGMALGFAAAPMLARYVDRRLMRAGILVISAASGVVLLLR